MFTKFSNTYNLEMMLSSDQNHKEAIIESKIFKLVVAEKIKAVSNGM